MVPGGPPRALSGLPTKLVDPEDHFAEGGRGSELDAAQLLSRMIASISSGSVLRERIAET
jgi:hypothetical protein